MGRVKKVSNPFRPERSETPVWTETTYDALGRINLVETPDGAAVLTAYDGNRTLVIDQAGKKRISRINAFGQLKDIWEITAADASTESISFPNQSLSAGYRTSYSYDGLSNLTEVSQGSQTRQFTYNNLSRLLSASNPESGTVSYTYDANGNLKTKRDTRNIKTVFDYDELNRVTNRCYRSLGAGPLGMTTCVSNNETQEPNTSDVTYTLENSTVTSLKGVLTKVANGNSITEYIGFDATGRVTRTRQTTDGVIYGDDANPMTYTYSLSGALLEQKYPSGRVVKNVLDQDSRLAVLQSKKNPSSGYWNYAGSFSYNAAGAVTSTQLGNGRWESTVYNSRLQPTDINLGTVKDGYDKLRLQYSYGDWNGSSIDATKNNGNIVQQIIATPNSPGNSDGFTATQKYYYDSLNRIDGATEGISGQTWRQDFSYDRYGNRNFVEANTTTIPRDCGTSPNFTICTADQKKYNPSINGANNNRIDTSQGYSFDLSGNTIGDSSGNTFGYDAENKQVEAKNSGNFTIGRYYYDGDGKRVKKIAYNSIGTEIETTVFVYDVAGKQIAEYSDVVATSNDAKVAYLTNDHLGSPRINTNANGAVAARHDYHPFGEELMTSQRTAHAEYGGDTIRKQFTGYERDKETVLDYAGARYLSSLLGRFTTADPIGLTATRLVDPQQLNRFVYTRNSPLKFVDPDGRDLKLKQGTKKGDADTLIKRLTNLYRKERGREAIEKLAKSEFRFEMGVGKLETKSNIMTGSGADTFGSTKMKNENVEFNKKANPRDNSALVTPAKDIVIEVTLDLKKRNSAETEADLFKERPKPISEQQVMDHEIGHAEDKANNLIAEAFKTNDEAEKTANDFAKTVDEQKSTMTEEAAEKRVREILGVPKPIKKD